MILFCDSCRFTFELLPQLLPAYQFELECSKCHAINTYDLSQAASEITDEEITDPIMTNLDEEELA